MPSLDLARLESLGFFRHVDPDERPWVDKRIENGGPAFDPYTQRVYGADAEELAEGSIVSLLGGLSPFLRREGVPVDVTYAICRFPATRATETQPAQPAREARFELDARGWLPDPMDAHRTPVEALRLVPRPDAGFASIELERHPEPLLRVGPHALRIVDPASGVDAWGQTTSFVIWLLNSLLSVHGSEERAFGIYGGNDFCVAFATAEMARIVNAGSPPRDRVHDGSEAAQRAWSKLPR